jgi:hypothetical protein
LQNSVMLMVSDLIEWVKRSCEKKTGFVHDASV